MTISTAETKVMEALWRRAPLSADEIIEEVADANGWTAPTVRTLLNRLLQKDVVSAEKEGRRYLYRPRLSRADHMSAEGRSLLDRLFDGRVSSLVTHFSRREQLSPEDIAELKRLVAEIDDER